MPNYGETTVRKARDGGWRAETNIDLGNGRMLKLSTWKMRKGVETNAQVCKDDGMGMFSFIMFQDYSKTVLAVAGKATEAKVREVHALSLTRLDDVKADIAAFYATKEVK